MFKFYYCVVLYFALAGPKTEFGSVFSFFVFTLYHVILLSFLLPINTNVVSCPVKIEVKDEIVRIIFCT